MVDKKNLNRGVYSDPKIICTASSAVMPCTPSGSVRPPYALLRHRKTPVSSLEKSKYTAGSLRQAG